ncbi:AAA family ATPase [Cupriavidus taiwanensis]|uniref:Protein CR006 P-loop domain-containing protein n=1 Tax=Cupriavidus taiwanensis TaxID=164546 RepID=A0A975WTN1_9BURK|nr:conserved hypothetical protein [Cupriavidus taiwanensis]
MIKTISIQGVKSFPKDEPHTITIDNKRVALFYGINGAGKSTIGEVIHRNGNNREPYADCALEVTGQGPYCYLVYNDEFVDRNFRGKAEFPGIFTIGEKDASALQEEEEKQKEYDELARLRETLKEQRARRTDDGKRALQTASNATWGIYQNYSDGPLKACTTGYGNSKQKLFDQLAGVKLTEGEVPATIEDMSARLKDLEGNQPEAKEKRSIDFSQLASVEGDLLWGTAVVGSSESSLSALIHELGNIDWIGQGRKYLSKDVCPFCQQGLPHNFTDELSVLIDGVYRKQVESIGDLVRDYSAAIEAVQTAVETILREESFALEHQMFQQRWAELKLQLLTNLATMRTKQERPGEVVAIKLSSDAVKLLSQALTDVNARIQTYNDRIRNRATERKKVHTDFWKRMRHDYAPAIDTYSSIQAAINTDVGEIDRQSEEHRLRMVALQDRLAELRKKNVNTDHAVEAINKRLRSLGVLAFQIKKKEGAGNLYCLERPGEGVDEYRSLSEGEKTLISFFYFLAHVNGALDVENPVVHDRKIVVVDDPISSLSHNYVYDIASIVVNEIIGGTVGSKSLKQVFILTHSLFFYHELLKLLGTAKNCQFFRVLKNGTTAVLPMDKGAIKNEYSAFWQVLKDVRDGHGNEVSVPNAMRCIFEYFFAFTQQEEKFKDALKSLEAEDYTFTPLARYLDRKSHADPINLFDHGGYDGAYYLAKFKTVFERTQYTDHYATMMGEEPPEAQAPA